MPDPPRRSCFRKDDIFRHGLTLVGCVGTDDPEATKVYPATCADTACQAVRTALATTVEIGPAP